MTDADRPTGEMAAASLAPALEAMVKALDPGDAPGPAGPSQSPADLSASERAVADGVLSRRASFERVVVANAGSGNLAVHLASQGVPVHALEPARTRFAALERAASRSGPGGRLTIERKRFPDLGDAEPLGRSTLVVIEPPLRPLTPTEADGVFSGLKSAGAVAMAPSALAGTFQGPRPAEKLIERLATFGFTPAPDGPATAGDAGAPLVFVPATASGAGPEDTSGSATAGTKLDSDGLNRLYVRMLGDIRAEMGIDAGGLANNYSVRVDRKFVYVAHDLPTAAHLKTHQRNFPRTWVLAAGMGELAALLALDGRHVVAVERHGTRYASLKRIFSALVETDPSLAALLQAAPSFPPEGIEGHDTSHDLALAMGVAFTGTQAEYDKLMASLRAFGASLIDVATLFRRVPPDTWDERAEMLAKRHGFHKPEHAFDWGSPAHGGRVFLFHPRF